MKKFSYKIEDFLNPILESMKILGSSANSNEIEEKVIEIMNLNDEEINEIHQGNRTKLNYYLAWAKNTLKNYGILENSSRGVWSLTQKGYLTGELDTRKVKQEVNEKITRKRLGISKDIKITGYEDEDIEISWEDSLLDIIKNIEPDKFERLCQRMLRELGFVDVKVTGRSGDGGIDGLGIIKINDTLTFNIVFQAKRFKGTVSSNIIRDFRGAMIGRADKGLIITTGTFTRDAILESRRDGAPIIDLIDGIDLVRKLKKLKLGVDIEFIEKILINKEWFDNI